MVERVETLLGGRPQGGFVGTFHRFALQLLRNHPREVGLPQRFAIADDDDQRRTIEGVLKRLEVPTERLTARAARSRISAAKNALLTPKQMAAAARFPDQMLLAEVFEGYQAALTSAGRGRLRRHAAALGPPARPGGGDPQGAGRPLPLGAGRRVPGHQRGAGAPAQAAHRQAPEPHRGRRRGPVDLPLARRPGREHPALRPDLPRRQGRHPRAQLPLRRADPARRRGGDRQQHPAPAEEALVGGGRRACRSPPTRRPTRSTRRASSPRRSSACAPRCASARWRCCSASTRSRGRSRRSWCAAASRTWWWRAPASGSAPRSRTRSPTCGCWSRPTTRWRSAAPSRVPPRGIGDATMELLEHAAGEGSVSLPAAARRLPATLTNRARLSLEKFFGLLDELRELVGLAPGRRGGLGAARPLRPGGDVQRGERGGPRPPRQPRRAGHRRRRGLRARSRPRRLHGRGGAGRRRRPARHRRGGAALDAARRQGAGVRRRVPGRDGGRPAAAAPRGRRLDRGSRGGAPPGLRRHDPRPQAPLPDLRAHPPAARQADARPAVAVLPRGAARRGRRPHRRRRPRPLPRLAPEPVGVPSRAGGGTNHGPRTTSHSPPGERGPVPGPRSPVPAPHIPTAGAPASRSATPRSAPA